MSADRDQNMQIEPGQVQIQVGHMELFNYALYQNHVSPIRDITLLNRGQDPAEGLTLTVTSDADFFREFSADVPPIPPGKPLSGLNINLEVNGRALAGISETVFANITVRLVCQGSVISEQSRQMKILAYDEWPGFNYTDLLASLVMPNHPVVTGLIREASNQLTKWGKKSSLEGYQENDPNRVRDLAAAVYAAIQKQNIAYCEPPASFEGGQRVRTPEVIMEQRLGTCMDMTLLYASCLEAIGLHPILVLLNGHIFAGVWLSERSFKDVIVKDIQELLKRFDNKSDELTFVECTAMCAGQSVNYEQAEQAGKYAHFAKPEEFQCAVDVFRARRYGVKPLPARGVKDGIFTVDVEERAQKDLTAAPKALDIGIVDDTAPKAQKKMTKLDLWESKLLDLSRHNMLLNLPTGGSVEPIMSAHIDELEDALADGEEFRLLEVPEEITDVAFKETDEKTGKSKLIRWLPYTVRQLGVYEMTDWQAGPFDFNSKLRSEFRSHRLYTFQTAKELEKSLTNIYRAARASQQENGVSSLYLAVGLLRWFDPSDPKKPCYAPLVLLPVEIVRKSANQGYALHMRDEDPHFNTTLLELLKQNFGIEIGGVDPLPSDEHGIDIRKVFAIVRSAVLSLPGWDVVESCVIGNFSFSQFAMWNDLHGAEKWLEGSDVVRSLMKGYVDFDVTLPDNLDEEKTYLPISLDATQLHAVKMAAHGATFVLHGPPGTGKSQTITAMIANLMAQGKTVLFVAEKMAALSVVQKRLSQLGIGDFCLELHSDKASKKQVLTQLDRALNVRRNQEGEDYEEVLSQMKLRRGRLDGYREHLHEARKCGYSLRELIDLYEGVRGSKEEIRFNPYAVRELTSDMVKKHISRIEQLTAAGSNLVHIADSPLRGIGVTSYTTELRAGLSVLPDAYSKELNCLKESVRGITEILTVSPPMSRSDYRALDDFCLFCLKEGPALQKANEILHSDSARLHEEYARWEPLQREKEFLLTIWQEPFLSMNMEDWLNQYAAAEKKFFGKGAALESLRRNLQTYAVIPVKTDNIPALLQRVRNYQMGQVQLDNSEAQLPAADRAVLRAYETADAYDKAAAEAKAMERKAEIYKGGLDELGTLLGYEDVRKAVSAYHAACDECMKSEQALNQLLQRAENTEPNWLEAELAFCSVLHSGSFNLKDLALYNKARADCREVGLQPVIDAFENGMAADHLIPAYRKGLYHELIDTIISDDDVLGSFSGATFNESIEQFKRIDDLLLQETKSEIFNLLAARVPTAFDGPEIGREVSLLRKAISSNARGISIRELFRRIPDIAGRLCPCVLMSPNSVAQYLEQNNHLFDVVIFDEASQLPTCKAVGALARARNAVIAGDPKQMPPTSFFAGAGPQVDDITLDDLDSILDDALALGIPSLHLQWHYRSTHESLIEFSNYEFYGNKMLTFPSANDRERHVSAVHVDGIYSKGVNLKEAEAVAAEIIRRYRSDELRGESIGVVTFNVKQQALIEDLLNKRFQQDPQMDQWANSGEDPLFVKNLENVQGDERDVILFSIGYGPDEKGHVSMNFGPINKQGGGKRLNVAFSRARVTMTIFTSLYSSQILVTESSPDGLKAFRDFLRFAEGHSLSDGGTGAVQKSSCHGILQSIQQAIEQHGFQCAEMVGHSDFHVDLAVVDPYNPEEYLMGILLDGDNYRDTRYARDREVSQVGVLRHLGWHIHRVWTVDWWDSREREINKIMTLLDSLAAQSKADAEAREKLKQQSADSPLEEKNLAAELARQAADVVSEEAESSVNGSIDGGEENGERGGQTSGPSQTKECMVGLKTGNQPEGGKEDRKKIRPDDQKESRKGDQQESGKEDQKENRPECLKKNSSGGFGKDGKAAAFQIMAYQAADLPTTPLSAEEYVAPANRQELQHRIEMIMKIEAPILKDTLIRRLMGSFGVSRTNSTLAATEKALKLAKVKNVKYKGVVFCWPDGEDPKAYRGIRVTNERSGDGIAPQEICNAMCYAISQKGPMDKEYLLRETSRVLGYGRLGKKLEAALLIGLQYARSDGAIVVDANKKFNLNR